MSPSTRSRRLAALAAVSLLALACAAATPAAAQAPAAAPAPAAMLFDIPASPLAGALQAFAAQSRLQLGFDPRDVAGRSSLALQGRFAPDAALARLIAGTDLKIVQRRPGVYVLKPREAGPGPLGVGEDPLAALPVDETIQLDELVVTGTLIRGAGQGPSPVLSVDRKALERGGHATLADALGALPQNFGGAGTPATALIGSDRSYSNDSAATGVNLRGLGPSATLVLIDGRRMAGTGLKGNFADVSAIPTVAVERAEVLFDGASALYGSDAVGGVVNVRLRRDFTGAESRARYSVADGGVGQDVQLSQILGAGWRGGHAVLAAEYDSQQAIRATDRAFTASSDLRSLGGTDHRLPYAHPGNILAWDAVQRAYVPLYAIPAGQNGASLTPSDFIAGAVNLGDVRQGSDILPKQARTSLYLGVTQDLGALTEVTADVLYSRRRFAFRSGSASTILSATNANPFFVSPTGSTEDLIGYNFTDELGPSESVGVAENLGLTLGLARDLGRTWRLEAYGALAIDKSRRREDGGLNSAFLDEALGAIPDDPATPYSAARDGYFNPYGDGGANSAAVLDFIGSGYVHAQRRNRVRSASLKLDGTVLELPAGPLKLAIGAQLRGEAFVSATQSLTYGVTPRSAGGEDFSRTIAAAYAEARVPLVAPDQAVPAVRRLELSLAGRVERYSDAGSTANPKLGVVWEPVRGMVVRGSYGESFRAPTLADIHETPSVGVTFLPDTQGSSLILLESGGNPDLRPETAKTWTLGVDLVWPDNPSRRLSLTWFDTRFSNQVAHPVYDDIANALTNPIYAGFVTRVSASDPVSLARAQALIDAAVSPDPRLFPASAYGAIIDGRYLNAGALDVRGVDLNAAWTLPLGADRLELTSNVAWLLDYRRRLTANAPSIDYVDTAGMPVDLRAELAATWLHGPIAATATLRYVDDYAASASQRVAASTTADLVLRWSSPKPTGPLAGLDLTVSARNLFNRDPPFYDAVQGVGYDPANGDPLGRVLAVQLTKRW